MFASTTNANLKNCLRKRYLILKATLKHSCRSYSTSGLEYVKIFAYKIKNDQLLPQNTTVFQISSILLHTIKLLKHQSVCIWAGQESHFHLHLSWWSEAMDYREVFISDSWHKLQSWHKIWEWADKTSGYAFSSILTLALNFTFFQCDL